MSAELLTLTSELRRSLRRLRWSALLAGSGVVVLLPTLLRHAEDAPTVLALVLALCYLGRKAYVYYHHHIGLKQLRLEGQFIRLSLEERRLRQCLTSREHLWTHSCIVQALRLALLPAPHRPASTHPLAARLKSAFRRAFRFLRPSRLSADALLLGVLAVLLIQTPLLFAEITTPYVLLALMVILAAEVAQSVFQWQGQAPFQRFETALTDWTLASGLTDIMAPHLARAYVNTTLYRARPWFSRPRAATHANVPGGDGQMSDGFSADGHRSEGLPVPTPPRAELIEAPW